MQAIGYELCRCSEHGTVQAKHLTEREGPASAPGHYYECPGTREDPGMTAQCGLEPIGQSCGRPAWAKYPSDP
jgi:hypothetical protein